MSELASEMFGMSQILEIGVILSTILLTLSTFGLWFATARMNSIEKLKMTEALSHDNDNMTDLALTIEQDRHIERLHTLKKVSRRNRKGGIR